MIKVCFHVHSEYSYDSLLSLEKIADVAERNKIDVVVITDHDNLAPEEEIEKTFFRQPACQQGRGFGLRPTKSPSADEVGGQVKKVKIIVGEEIKTADGEIIGIFLKEKIKPRLSMVETIKKIKEQSGIVIVPHPFDRFRREAIKRKALLTNLDQIDVVEIFNSGNILNLDNKRAVTFTEEHNKIAIVGSDAHLASEIARTYIEMEDFNGPQDFLEKLKRAKFYTEKSSPFVHVLQTFNKIIKNFKD